MNCNLFIDVFFNLSIGSLGINYEEEGVHNIEVTDVLLRGTQNGLRIKSWARPSTGFVKAVTYERIKMIDVGHPIIIDQTYCPHPRHYSCPKMVCIQKKKKTLNKFYILKK